MPKLNFSARVSTRILLTSRLWNQIVSCKIIMMIILPAASSILMSSFLGGRRKQVENVLLRLFITREEWGLLREIREIGSLFLMAFVKLNLAFDIISMSTTTYFPLFAALLGFSSWFKTCWPGSFFCRRKYNCGEKKSFLRKKTLSTYFSLSRSRNLLRIVICGLLGDFFAI